mgnify:CR=1 FL=1
MKRMIALCLAPAVLLAETTHAANLAVIATPPGLLGVIIIGAAVFGAVGAAQVMSLTRGGALNRAWQSFLAGFAVMALAQLSNLLHSTEIMITPEYVQPALWLLCLGCFGYGVFWVRRTLG